MFRKWLSGFLVVQHFYVYTLHGTLADLRQDTLEVTPGRNGQSLHVKLSYKDIHNRHHVVWDDSVSIHKSLFTDGGIRQQPLGNGYKLSYAERHKYLTIEKAIGKQSYLFHIETSGDVTVGRLDHTQEVRLRIPGKFSTGDQGLYKADALSVTASEVYVLGKISAERLKFRIDQRSGQQLKNSPIINAPTGMLMIGHRLDIEQVEGENSPSYIENLFTNQGKIQNRLGSASTSYTIDLHGNDLTLPQVGRNGKGQSLNEITSTGGLTITRVRHLYNAARISLDSQEPSRAPGHLKIEVTQSLTNTKDILSQGSLEILGTVGNSRFHNTGLVQSRGNLGVLGFQKFLQDGHLIKKGLGTLTVNVNHFSQTAQYQERLINGKMTTVLTEGRLLSEGSLNLFGKTYRNTGHIISYTPGTLIDVEDFENSDRGLLNLKGGGTLKGQKFDNTAEVIARGKLHSQTLFFTNFNEITAESLSFHGNKALTNSGTIRAKTLTTQGISSARNTGVIETSAFMKWGAQVLTNLGFLFSKGMFSWGGTLFENTGEAQLSSASLVGAQFTNGGTWAISRFLKAQLDQFTNSGTLEARSFIATRVRKFLNTQTIQLRKYLSGQIDHLKNLKSLSINGTAQVRGKDFENRGEVRVADHVRLAFAKTISNTGTLTGSQKVWLETGHFTQSHSGRLTGLAGLSLEADLFHNDGDLETQKLAVLTLKGAKTGQNVSQNAGIITAKALKIDLGGHLHHTPTGQIHVPGAIHITGGGHFLNGGHIITQSPLTVDVGTFENASDLILPNRARFASRVFSNTAEIQVQGLLEMVNFDSLQNTGTIQGHQDVLVQGDSLFNQGQTAQLLSKEKLTLTLAKDVTNEGIIQGFHETHITAKSLFNHHLMGTLLGELKVHAREFTNTALITSAGGTLSLAIGRGTQNGTLFSKGEMTLEVSELLRVFKRTSGNTPDIESQEGSIHFFGAGSVRNEGGILSHQDLKIHLSFDNHGALQGGRVAIAGTPHKKIAFENQKEASVISQSTLEIQNLEMFRNMGHVISEHAFGIETQNFVNESQVLSRQSTGHVNARNYNNTGDIVAREGLSLVASESFADQGTLQSPKTIEIQGQGAPGTIAGTVSGGEGVEIKSLGERPWDVILTNTANIVSHQTLWMHSLGTLTVAGKAMAETLKLRDIRTLVTQAGSLLQGRRAADLRDIATIHHEGDLISKALTANSLGTVSVGSSGSLGFAESVSLKAIQAFSLLGKFISGGSGSFEDVKAITIGKDAALHAKGLLSLLNTDSFTVGGKVVSDSFLGRAIQDVVLLAGSLFSTDKSSQFEDVHAFTHKGKYHSGSQFNIQARQFLNEGEILSTLGSGTITTEGYANTGTVAAHEGLYLSSSHSYKESGTFHSPKSIVIKGQGTQAQGTQGKISGTISGGEGVEIKSLGARPWDVTLTNTANIVSHQTLWMHSLGTLTVAGKAMAETLKLRDIRTLVTQAGSLLQGRRAADLRDIATIHHEGDLISKALTANSLGTVSVGSSGSLGFAESASLKAIQAFSLLGKFISGGSVSFEDVKAITLGERATLQGQATTVKRTETLSLAGQLLSHTFISEAIHTLRVLVTGVFQSDNGATFKGTDTFNVAGQLHSKSDLKVTEVSRTFQNTGSLSAQGKMELQGVGTFTNSRDIVSGGDLNIAEWTGQLENLKDGQIESHSQLVITKATHVKNWGLIRGAKSASLTATTLENEAEGVIVAQGVQSPADLTLTVAQGHNKGQMEASGAITLRLDNTFTNQKKIVGGKKLTVIGSGAGSTLVNDTAQAHLHSQEGTEFKGTGTNAKLTIKNTHPDAKVEAEGEVLFGPGTQLENAGQVLAKGKVTLFQETLENKGVLSALSLAFPHLVTLMNAASSQLLSQSDISWPKLQSLTNAGLIQIKKALALTNLKNLVISGKVISETGLIVITHLLPWTNSGQLQGAMGIAITSPEMTNKGVLSSPQGTVGINSPKLTNLGTMSGQKVILNGKEGTLHNEGSLKATSEVKLSSKSLIFKPGQTIEAPEISLTSSGQPLVIPTGLNSLNRLSLTSPQGIRLDGLNAGYLLDITGPLTLTNTLTFSKGLNLNIPGNFTNAFGIWGEGPLTLRVGGTFTNTADCYSSTNALTLTAGTLVNTSFLYGHLPSTMAVTGAITNTKTLASGSHLTMTGQSLSNAKDANVDALGNLAITVRGNLNNTVGTLTAGGTMALKGNRLFNQRDGYRMTRPIWTSSVHRTEEVANSQNGGLIQSQSHMTLDFNDFENNVSNITSTQGDVILKYRSFRNLAKTLYRSQKNRVWTVVGTYKKHWKSHCRYDWAWENKNIAQGHISSYISAGRDVIFEVNGRRANLPTSVPQAWENYRQQKLTQVQSRPTRVIPRGIKTIDLPTVGSTLVPDSVPWKSPNSFLPNPDEIREIQIRYETPSKGNAAKKQNRRYQSPRAFARNGLSIKLSENDPYRWEKIKITNPRKVLLESLFPGLTNTGTIVGRTVTGNGNVGHLRHGLKASQAQTPQERLANSVIQAVNYLMGVGPGHLWRVNANGKTVIQSVIAPNEDSLELAANTPYIGGRDFLNLLGTLGLPVPHATPMGESTLLLDTPFHGGPVGNLLYTDQVRYLTSRSISSLTSRIVVVEHPHLTGRERVIIPPLLGASILQRMLINEFKSPFIYANVRNMYQQYKVLHDNALKQARQITGSQSNIPDENDNENDVSHREIITPEQLARFQDPAIVYELARYERETGLSPTFKIGDEIASRLFRPTDGQIVGNAVDLSTISFDVSNDMTAGEISLSAATPSRVNGATLEATEGNVDLEAPQLEIKSKAKVTHSGSGSNYTHNVVQKRAELKSKGQVKVSAPQSLALSSATLKGQKGVHVKTGHITQQDAEDVSVAHSESSKRKGWSKKTTVTHNETHTTVRTKMDGGDTGVLIETEEGGYLEAPIIEGPKGVTLLKKDPKSKFMIGTSQDSHLHSQSTRKKNFATQASRDQGRHTTQVHTLESKGGVRGDLTNAHVQVPNKGGSLSQTLDALEKDPKTAWVKDLRKNPKINWDQVSEIHNSWNKKSFGLTPGASLLVSLAVAIAVAGPASSLATSLVGVPGATAMSATAHGMATTAFKTIASQAALSLANNKGNIGTALKQLVSTQNIKHLAATVAASGIIGSSPELPATPDLLDYAQTAAIQTTTQKATQVAIEGKSLKRALKEAPLEIAVDSLSGYGAQKIGDMKVGMMKAQGQSPALGHKIGGELIHKGAHAALGATTGAVLSKDKKKGAISGAIGAVVAETVAEHLPTASIPGQGIDTQLTRPTLPQHTEVAKLVATTVATVSNGDANIALRAADTAVRYNNLGHHFISGSEEANEKSREQISAAFEKAWEEANTEVPSMLQFRDRIIEATQDPLLDKAPGLKAEFESKSQKYISLVPTTRFDVATNIPGPGTILKSGGMAVGLGVKALKMGKATGVVEKAMKINNIPKLSAPKMADHHIFPQQFRKFFEAKGINIDEYTVSVGQVTHLKGLHGKGNAGLPGGWNKKWRSFIEENPSVSREDIYKFAGRLMDEYKLNDLQIHGYKQ